MIKPRDKINKLHDQIIKLKRQKDELIKKEFEKYYGKFLKGKPCKIVKISITHINKVQLWSNTVGSIHSHLCEDEHDCWYGYDEENDCSFEDYELDKLDELEEITEEEYNSLRSQIFEKAKSIEFKKLYDKYGKE